MTNLVQTKVVGRASRQVVEGRLVAAVLAARNLTEAARLAGVSRATAGRWFADPAFQDRLRQAEAAQQSGSSG